MTVAQHISDLKVCSLYSELSDWIERCRFQIDSSPEGQIASFMRDWLIDARSGLEPVIANLARIEDDRERALAQPIVRAAFIASVAALRGDGALPVPSPQPRALDRAQTSETGA